MAVQSIVLRCFDGRIRNSAADKVQRVPKQTAYDVGEEEEEDVAYPDDVDDAQLRSLDS